MSRVRLGRTRRRAVRLVAAVLLITAVGALAFLPFAGRYLISEDPLDSADVAFVLAGARVERWLEAVDLYRDGHVRHILLSPGREEPAEAQLRARGVRYPNEAELARDALVQLGVPAPLITVLPISVDNTAHEAAALRAFLPNTPWSDVLVITSKYHTRRTRFAFAREFRDAPVRIRVRATRHDGVRPDRWWRERADLRFVLSELQKLFLYRLGLAE